MASKAATDSTTALHFAAMTGKVDVVDYLVKKGASMKAPGGKKKQTALHLAVAKKHIAVIEVLMRKGANPMTNSGSGQTAWDMAKDNAEVTKALEVRH